MNLELIVKAMSVLSDTLTLDDYAECTKVFVKYVHRMISNAVKDMPYGASYSFTRYDSDIQTLRGEYSDKNMTLEVRIPVDCSRVDVSQIIEAHQTEGYVFNVETIQRTQKELMGVIIRTIAPIELAIKQVKEETNE